MARRLVFSAIVALGLAFTVNASLQANGQPDFVACEIDKAGKPIVILMPVFDKGGEGKMTVGDAVKKCLDLGGHPVGVDWKKGLGK